ncbi:quinone-dependent dihydroorotate dehydrogenase [Testudinibacter sp. TR-2022]|uniref:quinone-dependent dihydroorotate dehydrogenase n=1 Tax=Testudinibacter sp. TR-2022 TaxID=2585029 RepID=UPI0011193930|nr:quinone-dependent dihydroorotate dehydrogenase [Testudinibacter sp. TR-2022]TNH04486.1 quinone-dependent dihydroorotate dehydrogenase [Pasteurellaceae bacterium Phil31]TNH11992.1 quinone-dependent dihydroorotate dehydrogenase [Testudinibacter sp. TR-2022]TNH12703.1 quinone-dependent dihydroorotate dehydrogenase [Testudinibacter sp. TR-2022]TNH12780.1 quinone-dependent dihydroorotate dehydrogenase [Testudinibacter sp. TR-2022]TNH19419.1 quinone-dependent dihydroorotate dehydrogenase [Testudi
MYSFIKKGLFSLDAEQAHNVTLKTLGMIGKTPAKYLLQTTLRCPQGTSKTCMGIRFKNPIGLAAGADKNGDAIDGFAALGFGFIEVGTVTPLAQDGNPKPRQFRLLEAEGIINRNGFNNRGVDYLVENVKKANYDGVIGINIGKNSTTSVENGKGDYIYCLNKVYNHAGYITINISSPNSPGLRQLQYGEALDDLLQGIKLRQKELADYYNKYVPIAVKIAPDQTEEELVQIADTLRRHKMDGVIATNTTISRDSVQGVANAEQQGGLSGKPLQALSTQIISRLYQELQGEIPIIGSGGIDSVASGQEKIIAGAELLQLYSGLIYHGPHLVKSLVEGIK